MIRIFIPFLEINPIPNDRLRLLLQLSLYNRNYEQDLHEINIHPASFYKQKYHVNKNP